MIKNNIDIIRNELFKNKKHIIEHIFFAVGFIAFLILMFVIGNAHLGFKSAYAFEKMEESILKEIVSIEIKKQIRSDFKEKEIENDDPYCLRFTDSKHYKFNLRGLENFFPEIESGYCSNNEVYYHHMPRELLYQSLKKRVVFLKEVDKEKLITELALGGDDTKVIDRINLIIDSYKSHLKHYESVKNTYNKGE
ncbi:hypothetical protein [Moritella viscosa]|uniref:Uncharacterized protein n=1 Tax=Moritella viscosa TaxID=80854 RepID=A0A1L0B170_9GAMM|nr:hypothetical protein [Moritella viscosa]SGY94994.1 Putative uncharacterized protein [Moritella viscosa]